VGILDEAMIHNRALSEDEVKLPYESVARPGGPAARTPRPRRSPSSPFPMAPKSRRTGSSWEMPPRSCGFPRAIIPCE
jgi:hypothetical protein